jgi:hypothetical protein
MWKGEFAIMTENRCRIICDYIAEKNGAIRDLQKIIKKGDRILLLRKVKHP